MKNNIRKILREQIIDGENMGYYLQKVCNKMTINSYEEALSLVNGALQEVPKEIRTQTINKLKQPLNALKKEVTEINNEINKYNMSGDSIPDEADTYWHQIQTILCELGAKYT